MQIVGMDLSPTGTGVSVSTIPDDGSAKIDWEVLRPPVKHDLARMAWVTQKCSEYARQADLVVIEDFAFSASNAYAREVAGLAYMVRMWLHSHGKPFILVAPSSLKKFVTGKGNAEKALVMKDVYRRWGHDINDNNSADAVVLGYIGMALAGFWEPTTDQQREVVKLLANKYAGLSVIGSARR